MTTDDVPGTPDAEKPDPANAVAADAASATDGLLYGIHHAEAVQSLDPNVIAAIARLRDADPDSLTQLEAALTTKAGVFAEPHLLNDVRGVTAEVISAHDLGGTLADATNNPTWDIAVGDHLYQVKEGMTAADAVIAFAHEHPDGITAVTDVGAAAEAHAHGVLDVVGIEALEPRHIGHIVGETADGIVDLGDFAMPIPFVSAALIAVREVKRARAGEVQTDEVVGNIAVHVGGRAAAMGVLGWLGAALAIPTGGIAPIALGITGAIAGGRAANAIVASGAVKSVLNTVKAPYTKHPLTEDDVREMSQIARNHWKADEADLAEEAALCAEEWFRSAMARGEQMSAVDQGKALAEVVKPILQKRKDRILRRQHEEGQKHCDAILQSLQDKLVQAEEEYAKAIAEAARRNPKTFGSNRA